MVQLATKPRRTLMNSCSVMTKPGDDNRPHQLEAFVFYSKDCEEVGVLIKINGYPHCLQMTRYAGEKEQRWGVQDGKSVYSFYDVEPDTFDHALHFATLIVDHLCQEVPKRKPNDLPHLIRSPYWVNGEYIVFQTRQPLDEEDFSRNAVLHQLAKAS
jgi:hypothetical protein